MFRQWKKNSTMKHCICSSNTAREGSFLTTGRFKDAWVIRNNKENNTHGAGTSTCTKFKLIDGVLYRKCGKRWLFMVPKPMHKLIVITAHNLNGHFGVERTISRIMQDYWFPAIRRYVKHHINMCVNCVVHKRLAGRQPGFLHSIPPGRRAFTIVHIDHLGSFETSTRCNRYLLVIVDNFTKYLIFTQQRLPILKEL